MTKRITPTLAKALYEQSVKKGGQQLGKRAAKAIIRKGAARVGTALIPGVGEAAMIGMAAYGAHSFAKKHSKTYNKYATKAENAVKEQVKGTVKNMSDAAHKQILDPIGKAYKNVYSEEQQKMADRMGIKLKK